MLQINKSCDIYTEAIYRSQTALRHEDWGSECSI